MTMKVTTERATRTAVPWTDRFDPALPVVPVVVVLVAAPAMEDAFEFSELRMPPPLLDVVMDVDVVVKDKDGLIIVLVGLNSLLLFFYH
ncbi:hypothetical protein DFQ28_009551 [Apophysomyces sp. BC1034]|nr:hypothetical protein DFQ30_009406 [Apophysomyces sp. BC1015]KAG0185322.1 hypothetical protein DFQ28_009551 [Apophysomyces sp. BC1034]